VRETGIIEHLEECSLSPRYAHRQHQGSHSDQNSHSSPPRNNYPDDAAVLDRKLSMPERHLGTWAAPIVAISRGDGTAAGVGE
jgi:hypothetical protein